MPIEIHEPVLTVDDICAAIRAYCCAEEGWINLLDFTRTPCHATEASEMVLMSWAFLQRQDRPFIFPCRSCVVFVPHTHDDTTGCGPDVVFLDEWPPGRGQPRHRIEGINYHFGTPN